jgi:hypothetical protein
LQKGVAQPRRLVHPNRGASHYADVAGRLSLIRMGPCGRGARPGPNLGVSASNPANIWAEPIPYTFTRRLAAKKSHIHFFAILVGEVPLHIRPHIALFFIDVMLDEFLEHFAGGFMLRRGRIGDSF